MSASSLPAASGSTAKTSSPDDEIKCEICKDAEKAATSFCVPCSKYFCAGCQRGHKKPRVSAGHEFVSVEKALKGKMRAAPVADAHLEVEARVVFRRDYSKVADQPVSQFGRNETGDGQLFYPYAVAGNSRGEIVVADFHNHRIQVFDRNGKFLFRFGSEGKGKGKFHSPLGVTIDQRNNQIVVADTYNHRIQIFDEKGTFLRVFGSNGQDDGQLSCPWGVVVGQQGNYVVADYSNHRIQIFNSQGKFLKKFGSNLAQGTQQTNWRVQSSRPTSKNKRKIKDKKLIGGELPCICSSLSQRVLCAFMSPTPTPELFPAAEGSRGLDQIQSGCT